MVALLLLILLERPLAGGPAASAASCRMSVTRRLLESRCALQALTSSRISCDVCLQLLYLQTTRHSGKSEGWT